MSDEVKPVAPAATPDGTASAGTAAPTAPVKETAAPAEEALGGEPEAELEDAIGAEPQPTGAPEKYEFKLPEGATAEDPLIAEFVPLAKEAGLSQEAAQKIVDLGFKMREQFETEHVDYWTNQQKEWVASLKQDKEVGGQKYAENMAAGNQALQKFTTKEEREELRALGLTRHPVVVRMLVRAGKTMQQDKVVPAGRVVANSKEAQLRNEYAASPDMKFP